MGVRVPSLDISGLTVVGGKGLEVELGGLVTSATLTESITGSSTLACTLKDDRRTALRSAVLQKFSRVTVMGDDYTLAAESTSSADLQVTFEDSTIARLRDQEGLILTKLGSVTRTEFARRLARDAGAQFTGQADEIITSVATLTTEAYGTSTDSVQAQYAAAGLTYIPGVSLPLSSASTKDRRGRVAAKTQISRGTTDNRDEDSQDCITRLAGDLRWRNFARKNRVWFGADTWVLLHRGKAIHVSELTAGVQWFNGTFDLRRASGNDASFVIEAPWAGVIGQAVVADDLGLLSGTWITTGIVRATSAEATTVNVSRAQADIPEPVSTADVATGTTGSAQLAAVGAGSAAAPGSPAAIECAFALSMVGDRYVSGGEGPNVWDCSGLAQAACAAAGMTIPRTTYTQWAALPSVPSGQEQPGDLFFFNPDPKHGGAPGHVAIYLGNGQIVQALNPVVGVIGPNPVSSAGTAFMGAKRPG